jgi:hypothetical protein
MRVKGQGFWAARLYSLSFGGALFALAPAKQAVEQVSAAGA